MKNKIRILVMGLVIASMTIPLSSLCRADIDNSYVDLKINDIAYVLNFNNWREVVYNVKNVGNYQANPTFYCDVFFETRYISDQGDVTITRTLLARQPFIAILYAGAVSPNHYKSYHWVNNDPDHYSARFVVWADSTNQFNEELSESDNWGYTTWFI